MKRRPGTSGHGKAARFRSGRLIVAALLALGFSSNAQALQNFTGKVTSIEVTFMPTKLVFRLDAGNAACPAGKALVWNNANQENNKAVMAALATSLSTGLRVTFYIEDNDTTCVGRFIYLVK